MARRSAAGRSRAWGTTSAAHVLVDVLQALEVAEAALLLDLPRGLEHAGQRGAEERGGEADAAHAGLLQLRHAERLALDAGHEVHRLRYRFADFLYGG